MDLRRPYEILRLFAKNLKRRQFFFLGTSFYWVLSIISFIVNRNWIQHLRDVENYQKACYVTDALLINVECRGFFGAGIAKFVLGLYWAQYQSLLGILQGVTVLSQLGVAELLFFFFILIWAAALWLPLAYPFWYLIRRKQKQQ